MTPTSLLVFLLATTCIIWATPSSAIHVQLRASQAHKLDHDGSLDAGTDAMPDQTPLSARAPKYRFWCPVGVGCNPTSLLPAGGLCTLRTRLNALAISGAPAPGGAPAALGGFRYLVRPAGGGGGLPATAVAAVEGAVYLASGSVHAAGAASDPSAAAKKMIAAMYMLSPNTGGQVPAGLPAQGFHDYDAGHIIAAQLGGDNDQPLNFFPHADGSNSGGRYWRAEMVARAVKDGLAAFGGACTHADALQVQIELHYDANYNAMSNGGVYKIYLSQACAHLMASAAQHATLTGLGADAAPAIAWVTFVPPGTAPAAVGARGVLHVPPHLKPGTVPNHPTDAHGLVTPQCPYYVFPTNWVNTHRAGAAAPNPDQTSPATAPLLH